MFVLKLDSSRNVVEYGVCNYLQFCELGYKDDPTRKFINRTDFLTDQDLIMFNREPLRHYIDELGLLQRLV